jgi:hypothetical protein
MTWKAPTLPYGEPGWTRSPLGWAQFSLTERGARIDRGPAPVAWRAIRTETYRVHRALLRELALTGCNR